MLNLIVNKVNKVLEDRKLAQQGHLNNLEAAARKKANPLAGKKFPETKEYIQYIIEETSVRANDRSVRKIVVSSNGTHTVLISDTTRIVAPTPEIKPRGPRYLNNFCIDHKRR